MAEMDLREEVRVAWGTGIAGYVAESGEPVNIPDAYQVNSATYTNTLNSLHNESSTSSLTLAKLPLSFDKEIFAESTLIYTENLIL